MNSYRAIIPAQEDTILVSLGLDSFCFAKAAHLPKDQYSGSPFANDHFFEWPTELTPAPGVSQSENCET